MEFQYLDGGNSEVQDMQAEAYLYVTSAVGIAATGVIDGLSVAQTTTPSGSVFVYRGACINQASLGQGASRLINDTTKTLDIFTANPVGGLPRNDIVVFDSVTKLIIAITGTPNATPTDPTVPATAVALARLRNLASATTIPNAQIDTLIVSTYLRGTTPDVDTGWLGLTAIGSQWNAPIAGNHATARRIGNRVYMTGTQQPNTGTIGIGTTTGLGTLPAGMFPPAAYSGWAVGWISGTTDVPAEVNITAAGVVSVTNTSVLTGIKFHGISFLTD